MQPNSYDVLASIQFARFRSGIFALKVRIAELAGSTEILTVIRERLRRTQLDQPIAIHP